MIDVIPGLTSDPPKPEAVVGTGGLDRMSTSHQQTANQRERPGINPSLAHLMLKQHDGAFISF